jgi:hypothetical protein
MSPRPEHKDAGDFREIEGETHREAAFGLAIDSDGRVDIPDGRDIRRFVTGSVGQFSGRSGHGALLREGST